MSTRGEGPPSGRDTPLVGGNTGARGGMASSGKNTPTGMSTPNPSPLSSHQQNPKKPPMMQDSMRSYSSGHGHAQDEDRGWLHPKSNFYRYSILFLCCMITFGSYYCYDIPGALKKSFFTHFTGLTQLQYNLMYSLYSWPNIVQVFLGGYIIDRYLGVRWGCALCCIVLCVGQILVTIGTMKHDVNLCLIGRFVFGIGGETLTVAQATYTAKWFKGAELATAFGVVLSFSRMGSAVNFDVSPLILDYWGEDSGGFVAAMWGGTFTCIGSLFCCLLLNFMDWRADNLKERRLSLISVESSASLQDDDDETPVQLKDVATFPLSLWVVFLITVSFYASVFVFIQNGSQFLEQNYTMTSQRAAFLMSLPYTVSALACPVFGYLVDRTGRAIIWILFSNALLAATFAALVYIPTFPPQAAVVSMGICYSICASALWPCVAIVVPMKQLSMAYGLQTAFQNAGLAVFPIVLSGLMPDASSTEALPTLIKWWAEVMMVFVQMSLASVVLTIVLWCIDLRGGGWLNASADVLEKREMEVAREEAEKRHRGTVAAQAAYKTHVHHRNKYLSRLGIRVHGGPRLRPDKPMTAPEWLDPRGRHQDYSSHTANQWETEALLGAAAENLESGGGGNEGSVHSQNSRTSVSWAALGTSPHSHDGSRPPSLPGSLPPTVSRKGNLITQGDQGSLRR